MSHSSIIFILSKIIVECFNPIVPDLNFGNVFKILPIKQKYLCTSLLKAAVFFRFTMCVLPGSKFRWVEAWEIFQKFHK